MIGPRATALKRLPTLVVLRRPPPTQGFGTACHESLQGLADVSPRLIANVVTRHEKQIESYFFAAQ